MGRTATVERKTKETEIRITIDLDGTGESNIDTGIGFLDHMLILFAKHGLFDLEVKIKGDLEVDTHHSIEDAGIVLGQAILQAVSKHRRGDTAQMLGRILCEADDASRMCFACAAQDTCYWPEHRKNNTILL